MKLQRLRVAELRQFRQPFELAGIEAGLNIFTGPNEAGKSTLVRAIRAACFERHRSTSVGDLRPFDDSAAAPTVELDFEIDGTPCRLVKSFLQKKRCELTVGSQRFEGEAAENHLAERLGFEFAGKGASQEKHWGIPGLLWIEQGAAHSVHDAVAHAADHLHKALDDSLSEVAASGGDAVVAQVRRLRDELLTGTGKPRAAYQQAIDDAVGLRAAVGELADTLATYQAQVDQLRGLRQAHATDVRDRPWATLREQQAQAEQALQAATALDQTLRRENEKLRQAQGLRALLLQRLADADAQVQRLAARETALVKAGQQPAGSAEAETLGRQADAAAQTRQQAAREARAVARQEDNRRALSRQLADAQARATELTGLLERASAEDMRAATLRREAALQHIAPAELATLRQQHAQLGELAIRQAAVATRLRFELEPGAALQLADEPIVADAERLLLEPTTLTIAGVGRIHIAPGGDDLSELAQRQAALQDAQRALLQRLGLSGVAEAEARELAHAQRLADVKAAEKARQVLAPQGLAALRAELDAALARSSETHTTMARLLGVDGGADPVQALPLDEAERLHEAASLAAEAATQHWQTARRAAATTASQLEAASTERDSLKALLDDPQQHAALAVQRLELAAAGAAESTAQAAVADIQARIAAARPDILGQDVARLRASADETERQHQARDRQIVQLETALVTLGAQGLEEELAQRRGELERAEARLTELRRRAEALDFLLQRLDARRQALTRRLRAPLQQRIEHYLPLLFPAGRLAVDEQLAPGVLTRPGPHGPEAADFDTLSFGAREQMGVICRLAYADLLKAVGRPTLIILDDALVHSDAVRLGQMKRVLFDAAQRHQVLLFTCHPANWRDMGVPLRELDAARQPRESGTA